MINGLRFVDSVYSTIAYQEELESLKKKKENYDCYLDAKQCVYIYPSASSKPDKVRYQYYWRKKGSLTLKNQFFEKVKLLVARLIVLIKKTRYHVCSISN